MTTPDERAFAFFERGELRDWALSELRIGFRQMVDPETGALFTEDAIARATQRGSFWWIKYDAIDLVFAMPTQSRAMVLADQLRPERAGSSWLIGYHGEMWGQGDPLPPSPGSGPCSAKATPGTIFLGSTTIPDPAATTARDPAGLRYQVLTTVTTPGGGTAPLTLVGIDTGPDTNLEAGTVLTWENPPLGAEPTFTVGTTFTGGLPRESLADYQSRLRSRIRHKAGAGNNPQMRGWGRDASTAVLDAYVYACAMHAGSTLVCVLQKRGATVGPHALLANAATLAAVTGYIVPPGSPVVPARAFITATTFTPEDSDAIVQLAQPKGNGAGWDDVTPWPGFATTPAAIGTVTDTTHFRMHSDTGLPGGASTLSAPNAPNLMWWNATTSRFEDLAVSSVTSAGGNNYDVVLAQPKAGMNVGDWISPDMARRSNVAVATEGYFDSLGPGQVVDLATDTRADRAARFPDPAEESPARAGQALVTRLSDALGAALSDASLTSLSVSTPSLPTDVILGPHKLTLGKLAVYELP